MTSHFVGIDLGGTGTRIVLVDEAGNVLANRSVTTASDPVRVIDDLATSVAEVANDTIAGIGVGASGPIDANGTINNPATLPAYTGIDLMGELHQRFAVPVVVDNDAVTAAYAETRLGSARHARGVLMVTLGTGVGVAMLTDGQPLRTASGQHPEAGHLSVPGDAPCYCGRTSCWEQHASRSALQAQAHGLGLDLDTANAWARDGDGHAISMFHRYGEAVAVGLADLLTVLGPDLVVLGGGGARFLDLYRSTLEATLARIVDCYEPTPIVPATLGDLAGAIGAALWAASTSSGTATDQPRPAAAPPG